MHLLSKLVLEICQEVGSLSENTEQNRLKVPTLPHFFQKTTEFIKRRKTVIDFLFKKKMYLQILCI